MVYILYFSYFYIDKQKSNSLIADTKQILHNKGLNSFKKILTATELVFFKYYTTALIKHK